MIELNAWMKILIYIQENPETNLTGIVKGLRTSITHTSNTCIILELKKIIQKKTIGRNTYLTLTPKGTILTQHLIKINQAIKEEEQHE